MDSEYEGGTIVEARRMNDKQIEIICPFCGKKHTHGHPIDREGNPGYRNSHCKGDDFCKRGYYYIVMEGENGNH